MFGVVDQRACTNDIAFDVKNILLLQDNGSRESLD